MYHLVAFHKYTCAVWQIEGEVIQLHGVALYADTNRFWAANRSFKKNAGCKLLRHVHCVHAVWRRSIKHADFDQEAKISKQNQLLKRRSAVSDTENENVKLDCLLTYYIPVNSLLSRSLWPRGLRRGSLASRLMGLRVRIPSRAWMSFSCEYFVLSGRGLCVGPVTRPEESCRVWCVWV